MQEAQAKTQPPKFGRWVAANSLGWVLGVVLVVLGALAAEGVGVGGVQVMVGLGMGAGVGIAQGRAARAWLGETRSVKRWAWASALGMALPFALFDVLRAVWSDLPGMLPVEVALGGLLVGFLQHRLLRSRSESSRWWVAGSLLGWSLAAGLGASGPLFDRVLSGRWLLFSLSLAAILLGGVVLGAVTGGVMLYMKPPKHGP